MRTKPNKPEVIFDAEALIARVERFGKGLDAARERTVRLLAPVNSLAE